jgi:Zn-dependent peptidase ImmA (M78 family)
MEAMTKSNQKEISLSFVDEFFDDLQILSDDEIVLEAIEDFGSVEAALGSIRSEVQEAITSLAKDKLAHARSSLLSNKESRQSEKIEASDAKKLLEEFLSSDAGRSRLTMAARKGKRSSEKDTLGAFYDLCALQGCSHSAPRLNFGSAPKADYILKQLGVTEPHEIDVEAIAWYLGAVVRYDDLQDCEARIVGTDDAAIITVNKKSSPQRQRFSVCHELGHWIYHRRRMLMCQGDDIERPSPDAANMERMADKFASELLMPNFLFGAMAQELGRPSMSLVRKLAETFNTSQTAAAIRLVEVSQLPMLLTCYSSAGRKWFARSQCVAKEWFPRSDLSHESSAFCMVFRNVSKPMPSRTVSASTWFDKFDASRWEVIEESVRTSNDDVLTLLAFKKPHEFLLAGP